MDQNKSTLERAFELAKSGQVKTVTEIRSRLKSEGYPLNQIMGATLTGQLRLLIREHAGNPNRTA